MREENDVGAFQSLAPNPKPTNLSACAVEPERKVDDHPFPSTGGTFTKSAQRIGMAEQTHFGEASVSKEMGQRLAKVPSDSRAIQPSRIDHDDRLFFPLYLGRFDHGRGMKESRR